MVASKQRMGFLSNLARSLGLALIFMSLMRFLFYWNFSEKFAAVDSWDLLHSFGTGVRFDLLIWGFLLIPVAALSPVAFLRHRPLDGWIRVLTVYLCSVWVLIVGLSFADFLYFSALGQRLSLMAISEPMGREILRSAWSRLDPGTALLNAGIFFFLALIGSGRFLELLRSPPSLELSTRGFWKRWGLGFLLTVLAARGTVSAHHLEWRHAQISDSPILWELTINSPWAWDKNPSRGRR